MQVKISIDAKAVQRILGSLNLKAARQTMRLGLQKAARKAKRDAVALMYKHYNLKKKEFSVITRVKGPDANGENASVTIKPEPIGIERFKAKQTKVGVRAKIRRGGGNEVLPHAFLQEKKGKKQAFVRTKLLGTATGRYVIKPSKKKPFRSPKGSELPINRLLADPASEVVRPRVDEIARSAAQEATLHMLLRVERLLDRGRG